MLDLDSLDFGNARETQKDGAKALIKNARLNSENTDEIIACIKSMDSDAHEVEEFESLKTLAIRALNGKA
ncbi:hypothetical protein [Pseudomonas abieticivorans]|uniref:hypothetical protein n=1 Tax=Pseudomonas abieticivorans TaxID=2931382 RepID=UPI0020C16CD4|nr:hypothetical protein [Pseudomonas sp. PIA16]